jgi:hypothetical protein
MSFLTIKLIISFLIRIFFTFHRNNFRIKSTTADENGHLAHERLLAQGRNLKRYLKEHLFNRTFIGYPILFHQISSFLFKDYNIIKRRYLSGFFSILFPIVFFFVGKEYFEYEVVAFVTIALLLSLLTFGLFIKQYKAYTARSFADFLLLTGYLSIVLYFKTDEYLFYFLAIFVFSLVWFSSEFGIQSILLTSILWSIFSKNTLPIEISSLSLIVALLLSRKKILNILNHKFFHWLWYFRNSSWLYYKNKIKVTDLKSFYYKITSNIIVGKLLQFVPFLPVFIFYSVYNFNENQFVNSFILSTFIIAILTTTKTFSFIGPSYRYLLYSSPFLWMLLYESNKDLALILIFLEVLLSLIIATAIFTKLDIKTLNKSKYNELDKVLSIIDKKKNTILLSPVTLNQVFFSRSNNIKGKYISIWDNDFNLYALNFFEKYMKIYPYLNNNYNDLLKMAKETNSNTLVIDKIYTKDIYGYNYIKRLKKNKILYESNKFLIIKFNFNL